MKNYMEYKGYRGTISYCGEDRILYGKVLGTKDSISYEGESVSVTPELHRSAYFYAHENGLTLNELMSRSLKNYLDEKNIHLQA